MAILYQLLVIYALGSIAGWFIEVGYRSILNKKLINPGFLGGPYLPIYGFGAVLLYIISSAQINFLYKLLLFAVLMTALELVTGIFFFYVYNIRLWDYSENLMNYKGIISPLYSFFWAILSLLFYMFVYPPINHFLVNSGSYTSIIFLVGVFYGIFLYDTFNSFNIAFKIRTITAEFNRDMLPKLKMDYPLKVNYLALKTDVRSRLKRLKEASSLERFFFSLNSTFHNELYEQMRKNFNKISKRVADSVNFDRKR